MQDDVFPRHYGAWKMCITQKCKIPLTREYIETRIESLTNEDSPERKVFEEKYGKHWTGTVINYFKQALREV
ncbi:MAG: hypothetical protein ACPGJV_13660 [Bacteriovoracaceae bacterium]